jgi:hypothetical protein
MLAFAMCEHSQRGRGRERRGRQLEVFRWLAHLGGHGRQQQQEHRRRRRLRRCRHHSLLLSSISHPTRALISSRMFRSFRERPYRTASC